MSGSWKPLKTDPGAGAGRLRPASAGPRLRPPGTRPPGLPRPASPLFISRVSWSSCSRAGTLAPGSCLRMASTAMRPAPRRKLKSPNQNTPSKRVVTSAGAQARTRVSPACPSSYGLSDEGQSVSPATYSHNGARTPPRRSQPPGGWGPQGAGVRAAVVPRLTFECGFVSFHSDRQSRNHVTCRPHTVALTLRAATRPTCARHQHSGRPGTARGRSTAGSGRRGPGRAQPATS